MFLGYLSSKINTDKILAENRTERYKEYSKFIEEIEKLSDPIQTLPNRKSIYVKTQPKYKTEFKPIIQEMNELCCWAIETSKSKEKNS